MKFAIPITLFLILTSNAFAFFDRCTLAGDHAVMFAKWKAAGKTETATQRYIDDSYSGQSDYRLYKALASDIYASKRKFSPRQWRILIEDKCKEATGQR